MSRPSRRWWTGPFVLRALLAGVVLLGAVQAARADDEPGIARVSLIEGDASYLRGDADDWTGVGVNAPLVTGDRFYTGAESRAEIQLDPAVYVRLSSETEVDMLELGPDATQVRMSLGLATFRVRRAPDGRHVEVDTPGAALVLREAGVYRVNVERNGDTNVQVRGGDVTAYVAGEQYQIGDGRGVAIEGIGDAARPRIYAASGADGWDEWETQRANRVEGAVSAQYVSDGVYGVEDLDDYGDWESTEQYGSVWRPRVDAGWAPYTDGRWVWVDPWGWTWLDYAPWGWAPFHYGRWVYTSGYWGWAPGPIVTAPVYAPALVGWYGGGWGGVGVSVGFGFGAVGWTPLGWGEPCFPWWGGWGGVTIGSPWWGGWGGPRIYNNVVINKNITNINVNNYNFNNIRNPGGLSSVPVGDFQNGRGRITPVGATRLDSFRALGGRMPVTPTRDSLPATNPSRGFGGRAIQPPNAVDGRSVMTARTPTTGGQPSFDRKLPVVQRNQGAPLTPTTLRDLGRDSGRAPLLQSAGGAAGTGRQVRALPAATSPSGGRDGNLEARDTTGGRTSPFGRGTDGLATTTEPSDAGRAPSFDRSGGERAGVPRQTTTFPTARTMPEQGGSRAPAVDSGGRSIARPPTSVGDSGRTMPVAPRDGGTSRQPYVARRPAWGSDPGTAPAGGAPGGSDGRGAVSPRTTLGSRGPVDGSGGGRAVTAPRTTDLGDGGSPARSGGNLGSSSPTVRSDDPGSAGRSLPGGSMSRTMPSAPRAGGAPSYPPTVRSAPAPDRGGGSRSYFSQPRTTARSGSTYGGGDPRSAMRTAPSRGGWPSRSSMDTAQRGGSSPRAYGSAPPARSMPSRQMRTPSYSGGGMQRSAPSVSRGYAGPSAGATRSFSAPSAGASRGFSAPSAGMSRGFSGGSTGGGGGFARSGGGGFGGGSGGGFGGGRSFGGGGGGRSGG